MDLLVIIVLKLIFKRARPPHHQTDGRFVGPDQHSFPSGHATRVGCIVGLIFYLAQGTLLSLCDAYETLLFVVDEVT